MIKLNRFKQYSFLIGELLIIIGLVHSVYASFFVPTTFNSMINSFFILIGVILLDINHQYIVVQIKQKRTFMSIILLSSLLCLLSSLYYISFIIMNIKWDRIYYFSHDFFDLIFKETSKIWQIPFFISLLIIIQYLYVHVNMEYN